MFKSKSYVEVNPIFFKIFPLLKLLAMLIHKLQVVLNIPSFNSELYICIYNVYFFLLCRFLNTQLSLNNIL